jgi:hypothetical protein
MLPGASLLKAAISYDGSCDPTSAADALSRQSGAALLGCLGGHSQA